MSDTIGKFFKNPVAKPGKQPVPVLSVPTEVPFQPPPTLSTPTPPPAQPPPTLSVPKPQPDQTAVFHQTEPADIPFQAPPKLSAPEPAPLQPAPALTAPDTVPTQPAPAPRAPAVIGFEPPPALRAPAVIPFEPAPALTTPPVIPFEPAPPLTVPPVIPFEPAPPAVIPPAIPFEPAPPTVLPQPIPFEDPPPLTAPAVIPFEPAPPATAPAVVPFEPPPVLTAPAPVPPPPPSTPGPEEHSTKVLKETPIVQVGALGLNVGLAYGGRISAGFDPHIKEVVRETLHNAQSFAVAKAQALLQQQVDRALAPAESALRDAQHTVEQALRNLNPFAPTSALPAAQQAPGGSQIPLPDPEPGKQPRPHTEPSTTELDNLEVQARDETFPYNREARAHAQVEQETQALKLDSDINKYNSWNDNFDYGSIQSEGQPKGLQRSFAVSADGANNQPSIIQGPNGADLRGYFPFNGSEQSLPHDDTVYVPLVFTDLRPDYSRQYRAVYFRPFIKSLNENFAPQWNLANYFGRVDPVGTYKSTNRNVSLSFKLTCFSPEDLAANYRKLAWLSSMCYPEYEGGTYFAGPVVRLRVGDVISSIGGATGKGVSGVITSLDINYDEAIWELTAGQKLPRDIEVSIGFQVLHDRAIGLTKTNGGMQFGGYAGGTSDIRKFRAAFGSVDYVNDAVSLPQVGQVPAIVPLTSNPLKDAGDFPTVPQPSNSTDGSQPSTDVQGFASFPSENSDGLLG